MYEAIVTTVANIEAVDFVNTAITNGKSIVFTVFNQSFPTSWKALKLSLVLFLVFIAEKRCSFFRIANTLSLIYDLIESFSYID